MKSFRARVVLWVTVVAGLVMLGFGIAGNIAFERVKLAQVDDSLRGLVERLGAPPHHTRYWDRVGAELHKELEKRFGTDSLVVAYGYGKPSDQDEEEARFAIVSWGNLDEVFTVPEAMPATEGFFNISQLPGRLGPPGSDFSGPRGRGRNGRNAGPPPEVTPLSIGRSGGDEWRAAYTGHRGYNVLLAVNYEAILQDTALMRSSFAIVFPVALLFMGFCIWILVTRAIRPIGELSAAIENVSARSLDARLSGEGSYSEFAPLIEHFNGMLGRLERSFGQATRFSADAAHELKTPLAILQGQLEVAFHQAEDGSESQKMLAGLLEETHRLTTITRKLLILAKADAGRLEAQKEPVDLQLLLSELVDFAREDDASAKIRFSHEDGELGSFVASGDRTLVRQILNNVLGNALKYRSPRESEIHVEIEASRSNLAVNVENACESLSREQRAQLFDRFVRADAARNRAEDGTGLGLSLSLEFAKALEGRLMEVDLGDERRMRIRLELPAFGADASSEERLRMR